MRIFLPFLIFGLTLSCTGSSKYSRAARGEACHRRYGDMVGYLKRFKDANVLTVDVPVPPAEGAAKPLAFDDKRRVLQCDQSRCWLGAKSMPFGPSFDTQLADAMKAGGHGACGNVYVAMTDTLPVARASRVLQSLGKASCSAHAVVRTTLGGLPPIEPTEPLRQGLRGITKAGSLSARSLAVADVIMAVEHQHQDSCQDVARLMKRLNGTSGYKQYQVTMDQLQKDATGFESCACSLPGEDEKILFQLVATRHFAYEMYVYGAKPIPPTALAGNLPAGSKMWNDLVQAFK